MGRDVVVHRDVDGWIVETPRTRSAVADGHVAQLAGESWTLHLPDPVDATVDADGADLDRLALLFEVSRDEEHVTLTLSDGRRSWPVPTRAHHYLLVTLARAKLEDHGAGLPDAEQGWRYADDLGRGLGLNESRLNVEIFRARRQVGALGVAGAMWLVERQPLTRKLRLGPSAERLAVRALGAEKSG
jgi:hypothetical protein